MKTGVRKLTTKQKVFVAEYQKDWDGSKAVIRAGFHPKDAHRAAEMAYQLLHKTPVKEALDRAIEERLRKIGIRNERVLQEIAHVGLSDLRNLYNEDGTLKLPHEWPEEIAPAVAGVETFEEYQGKGKDREFIGYTKKVKLWDPNPSLTNMAKNLGLIGNGKHGDKEEEEQGQINRTLTTLELSPKIVYFVKLAVERTKKIEAQKALSGKSQDEKPKGLLK